MSEVALKDGTTRFIRLSLFTNTRTPEVFIWLGFIPVDYVVWEEAAAETVSSAAST
jgi:hypothetical protein